MVSQWTRDLHGYNGNWPAVRWPGEARLALSFVLNFEEGAELAIADGDERNEAVYEACEEVKNAVDPCMMTHYEYGTRAGFWRIMDLLDRFGVKVTVSANGRAAARSPQLIREASERGHEISCHGYRWETHAHMDETAERACIARCVQAVREASGVPPVGWHTRSASSAQTRRLLLEHGGLVVLVIDGEGAGVAQLVDIPAEDAGAHGVKGADPNLFAFFAGEGGDALLHFLSRFIGKG